MCRGAAIARANGAVSERISRYSYGFCYTAKYNPEYHSENDRINDRLDGREVVPDQMIWVVKKVLWFDSAL